MVSALYILEFWRLWENLHQSLKPLALYPSNSKGAPFLLENAPWRRKKSTFPHWWAAQRTLNGTTRPASSSRNVVLAWASTNGMQFQRVCVKEGSSVSIEHCQTEDSSNPPVQDTSEWKESETTKAPWQNRGSTNSQDDRTFHCDSSPMAFVAVPPFLVQLYIFEIWVSHSAIQ